MRLTRPGARTKRTGLVPRNISAYPAASVAGIPGATSSSIMASLRGRRSGDAHTRPRHVHLNGAPESLALHKLHAHRNVIRTVALVLMNRVVAIRGLAVSKVPPRSDQLRRSANRELYAPPAARIRNDRA